ncbi:MAG TPA: PAS domain S-box protein [Syntrophorhabdaceae bacterium]|nr:PAS domain S-box protein [Syntrophorhabdaceae bacterium]
MPGSEDRYRSLFETSLDGMLLTQQDGTVLAANSRACEMFLMKEEELLRVGRPGVMVDDESLKAAIAERAKTGRFQGELMARRSDGSTFSVEVSSTLFTAANGQEMTAMTIRDVTERRRALEALTKSENRFRSLFETSQDSILVVDRDTGDIIAANGAACSLYGYTEDEFLRIKNLDVSSEPDKTRAAINNLVTRVPLRHHRKKDGTIFPVEIAGGYFVEDGRRLHTAFIRDITALKSAQEELKGHRDRLQELVKERTAELEKKTLVVEELNAALKLLLHQVQEEKEALGQQLVANVKRLVLPYVRMLMKGKLEERQRSLLSIMEGNLNEIVSPFLRNIQQLGLTPRETEVANLIRDGRTSKEIAEVIGVGNRAIDSYRNSIRKKLKLNNKKTNLQTHLKTL